MTPGNLPTFGPSLHTPHDQLNELVRQLAPLLGMRALPPLAIEYLPGGVLLRLQSTTDTPSGASLYRSQHFDTYQLDGPFTGTYGRTLVGTPGTWEPVHGNFSIELTEVGEYLVAPTIHVGATALAGELELVTLRYVQRTSALSVVAGASEWGWLCAYANAVGLATSVKDFRGPTHVIPVRVTAEGGGFLDLFARRQTFGSTVKVGEGNGSINSNYYSVTKLK